MILLVTNSGNFDVDPHPECPNLIYMQFFIYPILNSLKKEKKN